MRIGLDFDNTIVCYDEAIALMAEEMFVLPKELPRTKVGLRNYLRGANREQEWTAFQGKLYGPGMKYAKPFEGVEETLMKLISKGHMINIISHRSKIPYAGPEYDLHRAAKEWLFENLQKSKVFKYNMIKEELNSIAHFEETRDKKIKKIRELGCDIFVDDLVEILLDRNFPQETKKVLFKPDGAIQDGLSMSTIRNWEEFARLADGM